MGLKRNKYLLLLFLSGLCHLRAQSSPDTDTTYALYTFDTAGSQDAQRLPDFDPAYHYSEQEQSEIQNIRPAGVFDKASWERLGKGNSFKETADTLRDNPKRNLRKSITWAGFSGYFWMLPVLLILFFLLYRLLPLLKIRHRPLRKDRPVFNDEPDEVELRSMDTEKAIQEAVLKGDYRSAFRFRYLRVLKQLSMQNLIRYQKESTNYEYLRQLRGSPLSETFRILTLHFDGIWYGETPLDRRRYEDLDPYFSQFDRMIQSL